MKTALKEDVVTIKTFTFYSIANCFELFSSSSLIVRYCV